MIELTPAWIAALVARSHGQVILTREELADAKLIRLAVTENDRGELVVQIVKEEGQASG